MSQAKLTDWMARDLSELDLSELDLAVMEGATENAAVARALIADLKDRGLADDSAFLWVIDGSKALRKATKDHFGKLALIQRCQIPKARGILERLPPHLRAGASKALRQAFKAESEESGKNPVD